MKKAVRGEGSSLFSFSLFKANPRPDSFRTNPLWHPRDIREAAKGIIKDDEEGRDPPLSSTFLTLRPELSCHSRGIKFGIGSKNILKLHRVFLSSLFSQDNTLKNDLREIINVS